MGITEGRDLAYGNLAAGIVSAVFDSERDAQQAIDWLRDQGVPDSAISVVRRSDDAVYASSDERDEFDELEDTDEGAEAGRGALTGAGVGAGVGALFGLAAAAIPGIGPFITAGALTSVLGTVGGAAAAGAIVGGTSGALAGAFSRWGMSEEEAHHYASAVEQHGKTYVGVDMSQVMLTPEAVRDTFRRFHGDAYGA